MPRQHFFIKLFSLRCHFARLHADDNVLLLQLEEMRLMKIFCENLQKLTSKREMSLKHECSRDVTQGYFSYQEYELL